MGQSIFTEIKLISLLVQMRMNCFIISEHEKPNKIPDSEW